MGAVAMSPVGGLRQRLVLGPAVREKYSMHCGSENVDGRFSGVNEEPSGGIFGYTGFLSVSLDWYILGLKFESLLTFELTRFRPIIQGCDSAQARATALQWGPDESPL